MQMRSCSTKGLLLIVGILASAVGCSGETPPPASIHGDNQNGSGQRAETRQQPTILRNDSSSQEYQSPASNLPSNDEAWTDPPTMSPVPPPPTTPIPVLPLPLFMEEVPSQDDSSEDAAEVVVPTDATP